MAVRVLVLLRRSNGEKVMFPINLIEKRNDDNESVSLGSEIVVKEVKKEDRNDKEMSLRGLNQNGDPLGRRDLGRNVVKWISQAMKSMASDLATAEVQGEFLELRQTVGSAQPKPVQGVFGLDSEKVKAIQARIDEFTSRILVVTPFFFFFLLQPTWITQCPLLLLDTRMPDGSLSVGCEERLDPAGMAHYTMKEKQILWLITSFL